MAPEIAVETNHCLAAGIGFEIAEGYRGAVSEFEVIVRQVPGQIEHDRMGRIDARRLRILTAWEDLVPEAGILAGLAEHGVIQGKFRHMAARATDRLECLATTIDGFGFTRLERIDEAEFDKLELCGRARLGGYVECHRSDVADGHLVNHAIEIAINAFADQFDRLDAKFPMGGVARKRTDGDVRTFPLKRLDDEVVVGATDFREVERAIGFGRDPTEIDAFCHERLGDVLALLLGSKARLKTDEMQIVGHFFGQPLQAANAEEVRRVAGDELTELTRARGIAHDIHGSAAGPVLERLVVASGAALGVGTGMAEGHMARPFPYLITRNCHPLTMAR